MNLYTGKGDKGTTQLFDSKKGERFSKGDPIFEALGTMDELNCVVGWAKARAKEEGADLLGNPMYQALHQVQDALFTAQAELAGAEKHIPRERLEEAQLAIHFIEKTLPPITTFLVPGGTELSARLDIARTLARRAERRVVTLHESGVREVHEDTRAYLNRLSSLLYALVRYVNHQAGVDERPPQYQS